MFEFSGKDRVLIIYHYDDETKVFIGDEKYNVDADCGIPANSTIIKILPQKNKFLRIFDDKKWKYVAIEQKIDPIETKQIISPKNARRSEYRSKIDDILSEACIKKFQGFDKEYEKLMKKAISIREKIQKDNPL